jgi:hypothetical protein
VEEPGFIPALRSKKVSASAAVARFAGPRLGRANEGRPRDITKTFTAKYQLPTTNYFSSLPAPDTSSLPAGLSTLRLSGVDRAGDTPDGM